MNFLFLFIIFIFCCISAFLSASETAITMASRLRIHQLAKKGYSRARILLSLQEKMNVLISTILLANTCLFAAMTTLMTKIISAYLSDLAIFMASLVMGAFITLYLEVLPKIFAYHAPEKVGLFLAPFLNGLRIVLWPITHLIDSIAHRTLCFFGVKASPKSSTADDLRGAIDLHIGEGIIPHERVMLRSILDLSRVTVEEIMVHRKNILSFNLELPFEELCKKILQSPYTRIPLWKDNPDNIIGVINVKTLARKFHESSFDSLEEIMQPPWFIPSTSTLFFQLQLFKEKHRHQVFVVDEYGSLLGMVTLEDILEEIVGEIIDEHDVALPGVRLDHHGNYVIYGSVTLRDLHRQYDWVFGEENSGGPSTLAGLILHETRSIPEVGTTLSIKGFEMKILRRHHHQITMVRVTPPCVQEASSSL